MSKANNVETGVRKIVPDVAKATDASPPPGGEEDIRALAQLLAAGGCRPDHMRLVSWRNLRQAFDRRWSEIGPSVAATIHVEIAARLGPRGRCVRYDATSFLVLCPPPGDAAMRRFDRAFVDAVGAILVGTLRSDNLIEVLKPAYAADKGLTFAPAVPATDDTPPPSATGKTSGALVLGDAQFRYFPLWDVVADSVFCYLCEASWNFGDGATRSEGEIKAQFDDPKRALALDLETLNKASGELDKGLSRYQLAKFLIPVHYRTVVDPATAESYLRFCNSRMWAVHEFALFEIIALPDDATTETLTDAIERLAPFGAGIMLRVGSRFRRFDQVPADRVLSIGIDLRLDDRPDSEIIADIKAFAAAAGERGLRRHIHGLHTVGPSVVAACAGIDLIGSDAIAEGIDELPSDGASDKPVALLRSLAARSMARRGAG